MFNLNSLQSVRSGFRVWPDWAVMQVTVPTVHCTVQYRGEVAAPMTDLYECRIQEFQTRRTD